LLPSSGIALGVIEGRDRRLVELTASSAGVRILNLPRQLLCPVGCQPRGCSQSGILNVPKSLGLGVQVCVLGVQIEVGIWSGSRPCSAQRGALVSSWAYVPADRSPLICLILIPILVLYRTCWCWSMPLYPGWHMAEIPAGAGPAGACRAFPSNHGTDWSSTGWPPTGQAARTARRTVPN
jgi:hypothetical protein